MFEHAIVEGGVDEVESAEDWAREKKNEGEDKEPEAKVMGQRRVRLTGGGLGDIEGHGGARSFRRDLAAEGSQ